MIKLNLHEVDDDMVCPYWNRYCTALIILWSTEKSKESIPFKKTMQSTKKRGTKKKKSKKQKESKPLIEDHG